MNDKILPRLMTEKTAYTMDYQEAISLTEEQQDILWTDREIEMEKEIHDLMTNLTESEYHGVTTVLKLFTQYELHVGLDYWTNRVSRIFPRPDIQRMANMFAYVELNIHAPFYAKINELLGLATDEFFESYKENAILTERIDWIKSVVALPATDIMNVLRSLGAFSMIEGAILYSNFAFLKHFQSEGKNKLTNLVSGINFSVRDENCHAIADAWLFRTLKNEAKALGLWTEEQEKILRADMELIGTKTYEHESEISRMIFEKGPIRGITHKQLNNFVQSRVDLCLENLGYAALYSPTYNPVAKTFYDSIATSGRLHDFFIAQGADYSRNWKESEFTW